MKQINILMFNMAKYSDWQSGVVNRNYHILHTLARDERVAKIVAVDFMPFNFRRAVKTYFKDQIIGDTKGEVVYGDLTSRCWQVSSKILVYSTIDSVLKFSRITNELNKIIKNEKMEDNLVVWSYNPLYTDHFGQFGNAINVFDAVDNWLEHSSYKKFKKKLKNNYHEIGERADLIFTVSESLKDFFKANPEVHWVPNGVEPEHFAKETHISQKLSNIPIPIIGFLGILQDRIDVEIIKYIAMKNPDKSIVLAGPVWKSFPKKELAILDNVYFIGPVAYTEMPAVYQGFSVGIIPYLNNKFIKSTNSMKFYEYLAAGLPVVSTDCPGMEQFGDLIYKANTPEEFDQMIVRALEEDDEELVSQRKGAIKNKTWQDRVEKMLDLIYQQL